MKNSRILSLAVCLATAPFAFGQRWEFGGAVGGSFYTSQTFKNPVAGNADAKFDNGFLSGGYLAHNAGERWGGEIRYDFQTGNAKLSSGSTNVTFGAQAHSVQYHLQWHATPSEASVRPFVSFGGGLRMFRGTGADQVFQPLGKTALLTRTNQLVPVVGFGGGVKLRISQNVALRVAVYDFLSPFPDEVIAPNIGSRVGGWIHNITPMVGISALF
jgi:hypothetical protein